MGHYKCNTCGFTVPADEIGVAIMKQHLEGCSPNTLPLHRTWAGTPGVCSTCDGGGCLDCTDPA